MDPTKLSPAFWRVPEHPQLGNYRDRSQRHKAIAIAASLCVFDAARPGAAAASGFSSAKLCASTRCHEAGRLHRHPIAQKSSAGAGERCRAEATSDSVSVPCQYVRDTARRTPNDQVSIRRRGRLDRGQRLMRATDLRPGGDRPAIRHGSFRHLVQRGCTATFRSRHALPAFVLVPGVEGAVRAGIAGRPGMRDRLLGRRAQPAQQSARATAGRQPAARAGRCREGQGGRCEDAARARLHQRVGRVLHRLRQGRSSQPRTGLSQGHGRRGTGLPERRRGANPLCDRAQRRGPAERQDLRDAAQGSRHSRADLPASAAPSRRRALPDPPLRHTGAGGERARRRQALRADRAGGAACAAHAVAYLHPRRLLEGVDRLQCRGGKVRKSQQRSA